MFNNFFKLFLIPRYLLGKNDVRRITLVLFILAGFFLAIKFNNASANNLDCSTSTTLETLIGCIRGNMPASGSNGFIVPTTQEQADWRAAARQMLAGSCDFPLSASLSNNFTVRTFLDAGNNRNYCLMMETADSNNNGYVDRGWGTFIVYNNALREISHQAPHPIADSTTETQAITLFKETASRSYLLAGTHRDANSTSSSCITGHPNSDATHNAATIFQAANEELAAFYADRPWNAIQWHGMSASTCSNSEAHLSHGFSVAPAAGSKILQLKDEMLRLHPLWKVTVPGSGSCSLNATTNVQGRHLNGVAAASVCNLEAGIYKNVFIHVEQDPNFRNPADWIEAVNNTWASQECAPPAPLGFTAVAGDAEVSLTWLNVNGATSYNLKRSSSASGPFTVLSTVSATEYTDFAVTNGNVYYYVVSSLNSCGESPNSVTLQATPKPPMPAAPIALTATALSRSKISLNWQDASNNEDSFKIERSHDGVSFSLIATVGSNSTTYTNSNLKSLTTYYYRVRALNSSGASPYSNIAQATTTR
jgi:hypothetical protein